MNIELFVFGAIAVVIVGFFLLLVSVSLVEKQPVKEFVPVDPTITVNPSPYYLAVTDAATRLGFKAAGVFVPNRPQKTYRFHVALFVSPEHETLLKIAAGKVAGLPLKKTTLMSCLANGQTVETSDEPGLPDQSGLTQHEFLLNADLNELWTLHRNRLTLLPEVRREFTETNALEAYETAQMVRVSQLIRSGLSKYINLDRTVWRYTLKGALRNYFKGHLAQLQKSKAQGHRLKLKRPGSR